MYDDIINNMAYQILFDFNGLDKTFWSSTKILTGAFLIYWGIKVGVIVLKGVLNNP